MKEQVYSYINSHLKEKPRGFTLIEIMIAITILAVLATVGMTTYNQSQLRARDAKRKQDLRAIATGLELFYQQNKRYPCSGSGWQSSNQGIWLSDVDNTTVPGCNGTGSNIAPRYISSMPKDPMNNNGIPTQAASDSVFGYAYYSINGAYLGFTACQQGNYYILITRLENPNDPDILGETGSITFCGSSLTKAGNGYDEKQFIITSN